MHCSISIERDVNGTWYHVVSLPPQQFIGISKSGRKMGHGNGSMMIYVEKSALGSRKRKNRARRLLIVRASKQQKSVEMLGSMRTRKSKGGSDILRWIH